MVSRHIVVESEDFAPRPDECGSIVEGGEASGEDWADYLCEQEAAQFTSGKQFSLGHRLHSPAKNRRGTSTIIVWMSSSLTPASFSAGIATVLTNR